MPKVGYDNSNSQFFWENTYHNLKRNTFVTYQNTLIEKYYFIVCFHV